MPPRKPTKPPHKHRERPTDRPARQESHRPETKLPAGGPPGSLWLFGHHAVAEALKNPRRQVHRIIAAGDGAAALGRNVDVEIVERDVIDRLVGRDVVHQGLAARVSPLPETDIYEICDIARDRPHAVVVVLDQVTDPHNVGAILRSAAAFGAIGIILTERHAAPESGILAKSASGALEHVPLVRVTNLARAMEELKEAGFWCIGLAAEAKQALSSVKSGGKVALCLGAEGAGLRRLTRENCDLLVRLPTSGPIDHLNVSNAAAISLYELAR
ncbi:23S rRNA (guanosine(2251)-2'-O)-methyltransferase RlmB [Dongia sp.]|uniref:23S rRNA (guanosine(2251)-2'-O)-methyltransferase RlmB n=1 Tax=Dongia sp. TaxID=1977262 RepID=UPI0035B04DC8